jgi:biopolymer transport protein ExbB
MTFPIAFAAASRRISVAVIFANALLCAAVAQTPPEDPAAAGPTESRERAPAAAPTAQGRGNAAPAPVAPTGGPVRQSPAEVTAPAPGASNAGPSQDRENATQTPAAAVGGPPAQSASEMSVGAPASSRAGPTQDHENAAPTPVGAGGGLPNQSPSEKAAASPGPSGSPQGQSRGNGPEVAAPEPDAGTPLGALLPRDLSPLGMFLTAHVVVKAVMIGLAFASLVTWTVALAKGLELMAAKRGLRRNLRVLAQVPSLADAGRQLSARRNLAPALQAAMKELELSSDAADKAGVKERVASRLERIEARSGRLMTRGTGALATIGATAPFVGLFGTVWGIMNSFINISQQHTTNLAVVAPGIAEALLATALGLFAAIPAVVIYNMFSRSIASYRALYGDGTAEILRLVSRDLDRAEANGTATARPNAALSAAE